jgi:hypothetical protein
VTAIRVVLALVLLLGASACMSEADDAVGREAVVQAFAKAGEPLELALDMADADPESHVDAIYTPKEDSRPRAEGFEVTIFERRDAAAKQLDAIRSLGDFELRNNILVSFSAKTPALRRQRVVAILDSLEQAPTT